MEFIFEDERPSEKYLKVAKLIQFSVELLRNNNPSYPLELHEDAHAGLTYLLMFAAENLEEASDIIQSMDEDLQKMAAQACQEQAGQTEQEEGKS